MYGQPEFQEPPPGYNYPTYPPAPPPTSGLAVASLVSSVLWLCGLGSLLGVIFGHVSMGHIRAGRAQGSGLAVAGLILGYIGLVGTAIFGFVVYEGFWSLEQIST